MCWFWFELGELMWYYQYFITVHIFLYGGRFKIRELSIYWFPLLDHIFWILFWGQGEVTSLGCVAGFTQTVVMADSYGVLVFGYVTMLCLSNLETSPKEKEVEKGEWIDLWFRNILCRSIWIYLKYMYM